MNSSLVVSLKRNEELSIIENLQKKGFTNLSQNGSDIIVNISSEEEFWKFIDDELPVA